MILIRALLAIVALKQLVRIIISIILISLFVIILCIRFHSLIPLLIWILILILFFFILHKINSKEKRKTQSNEDTTVINNPVSVQATKTADNYVSPNKVYNNNYDGDINTNPYTTSRKE